MVWYGAVRARQIKEAYFAGEGNHCADESMATMGAGRRRQGAERREGRVVFYGLVVVVLGLSAKGREVEDNNNKTTIAIYTNYRNGPSLGVVYLRGRTCTINKPAAQAQA